MTDVSNTTCSRSSSESIRNIRSLGEKSESKKTREGDQSSICTPTCSFKRTQKQKRMYPTPRSSGQENAETLIQEEGREGRSSTQSDGKYVQMYPTPSASCQMDVVAPPETVKKNSSGWSVTRVGTGTKFGAKLNDVVNKVNQPIKPGGKLNPTFVEFLMGFPMDWTKVESTE